MAVCELSPRYINTVENYDTSSLLNSMLAFWGRSKKMKIDRRGRESCNKGGHKERSIVNQPNHVKHWKKKRNGGFFSSLFGNE